jgi:hypothetical protein
MHSKCHASGRWAIVLEDWTNTLTILDYCRKNPNADGSLPVSRIRALWNVMYENGETTRAWNHHRFKAMRDCLSMAGAIDWQCATYAPNRACQWSIREEVFQESSQNSNQNKANLSLILIDTSPIWGGQQLFPTALNWNIDHAYWHSRLKALGLAA